LNAAVSIVASFEVSEALKILTGNYAEVSRALLNFDLWTNEFHRLGVDKARDTGDCPTCKRRSFEFLEGGAGSTADTLCGRNAIQLRHRQRMESMNFEALAERLGVYGEVRVSEYLLRADIADGDKRYELSLFPDGRAIVKGTDSPAEARAAYARYVGT
ncbi:MAG: thiazole biosynthesis adenylyltransferase ThiF, partial [Pseudomonadota bacterium]